jgi:hypothetical protein
MAVRSIWVRGTVARSEDFVWPQIRQPASVPLLQSKNAKRWSSMSCCPTPSRYSVFDVLKIRVRVVVIELALTLWALANAIYCFRFGSSAFVALLTVAMWKTYGVRPAAPSHVVAAKQDLKARLVDASFSNAMPLLRFRHS